MDRAIVAGLVATRYQSSAIIVRVLFLLQGVDSFNVFSRWAARVVQWFCKFFRIVSLV